MFSTFLRNFREKCQYKYIVFSHEAANHLSGYTAYGHEKCLMNYLDADILNFATAVNISCGMAKHAFYKQKFIDYE